MYKFQVGDLVTVRKAPRELYSSEVSFVAFPDRLEGITSRITSIDGDTVDEDIYYVEGCLIRLFEFELHPGKLFDSTQEAEWE